MSTIARTNLKPLWDEWFTTHSDAARNRIVEAYMPRVIDIAEKIHVRLPKCVELDDLIQVGVMGTMDAIGKYDPQQAGFNTFASPRVHGAMLDWLREESAIPRLERSRHKIIANAEAEHIANTGQIPTPEELQAHMGVDDKLFSKLKKARQLPLFNHLSTYTFEVRSGDIKDAEPAVAPSQDLDAKMEADAVIQRMLECGEFKVTHALIVRLYYLDELTMKQIAAALGGMSESRISQMHTVITEQLRSVLKSNRRFPAEMERPPLPTDRPPAPRFRKIFDDMFTRYQRTPAEIVMQMLQDHFRLTDILMMRMIYIDGLQNRDVSESLNCSPANVSHRQRDLFPRIKDMLQAA